jgi:HAD superfamily hydrolase (TIGR01549 family)
MNKAILFDFGGTLDTNGIHWSEKFWDAYQIVDLPVTKDQYEKAYVYAESKVQSKINFSDDFEAVLYNQVSLQFEYLNESLLLKNILKDNLLNYVVKQCLADVKKCIHNSVKILEKIKPKYFIGVVSNFYGNLESVLKNFAIDEYFDIVIDSYTVGVKKPDPGIFKIALDRINVPPNYSVVIGDSYERDIYPAKVLGCKTIWLNGRSWHLPAVTEDADMIIHSVNVDLINIIEKLFIVNSKE